MRKYFLEEMNEENKSATEINSPPKLTVESSGNHVYFYSNVDSDRCLSLIKQIRDIDNGFRSEYIGRGLDKIDYPKTPIWLHVQSGGGDVFPALALIDQFKNIDTPIYSIVEGYVASAATLLTMCCTRRFIMPSSYMLIHQVSGIAWGKYEEIKDEMHLLNMLMETLTTFYKSNSKMTINKIKELLKRDSWFGANECVDLGLVDEIL